MTTDEIQHGISQICNEISKLRYENECFRVYLYRFLANNYEPIDKELESKIMKASILMDSNHKPYMVFEDMTRIQDGKIHPF